MAQVTSPIILDSTGQQIHSDLQQIKNVLTTPSAAADITFDNTGTGMQADDVQDAITELKSNLTELGMPDYAHMETIGTGSRTYTPTENGYIHFLVTGLASGNAIVIYLESSSGTPILTFGKPDGGTSLRQSFAVKKGQTYYLLAGGSSTTWSFVPLG